MPVPTRLSRRHASRLANRLSDRLSDQFQARFPIRLAARLPARPAGRGAPPARSPSFSHRGATLLAAALLATGPFAPAHAGDDDERARAAVQAGQIQPLQQVLDTVARQWNGEVIAVELDREDGGWVYEIKLLSPQGAVIKLEYDAQHLTLVKAKGRGAAEARKGS
ncbi:MAG: hypothetical protein QM674_18590 [Burkholderiaceae bacterium]